MNTTDNRIEQLTALGLSLAILNGPYGNVGDNEWPNIRFDLRLDYKGREVWRGPYSLGVGHVKPEVITRLASIDEMGLSQNWARRTGAQFVDKLLWAKTAAHLAKLQKVTPQLDDVIHSLMLDGEAFFSAQTFEQWADDFGYDKDSRKAESIWKACDETGRKLSNGIPVNVRADIQLIIQDL